MPISTPPYRDRFTFPNLEDLEIPIAVVGGDFPHLGIGQVDVGEVDVGETTTVPGGNATGYRDRFTFPSLETTETQIAVVGGDFPATIGPVDVGDVYVGQVETTGGEGYGYRDRYNFIESDLTP